LIRVLRVSTRTQSSDDATLLNASPSGSGSVLPRRDARRNIPVAAFAESAKRESTCDSRIDVSFGSTGDNEDSPAPLRYSKISGIQATVSHAVPTSGHFTEESLEVKSLVGREEAWNILKYEPSWLDSFCNSEELKSED
jgi:hypothetical protein